MTALYETISNSSTVVSLAKTISVGFWTFTLVSVVYADGLMKFFTLRRKARPRQPGSATKLKVFSFKDAS
jgi:hypothetical protein